MTNHQIYFAQHGLAVSKANNPDRPLSDAGTRQTEAIARQLRRSAIPVAHITHSGKLRALQTAQIFAAELNLSTVTASEFLSPNDDVTLLARYLQADTAINNTLYIGHLPHLEKLVSFLITGKDEPSIIQYQNSAVVCLQKNESSYQLRWYVTPEALAI
ncbi:MAG: phosphohistidine phosphatase SixA [Gammaproteobacteria bacterium]